MIIGCITLSAVGILFIILGHILRKQQKLSLLHAYHRKHVRREDIPAYTKRMGLGMILPGAGFCLAGVMMLFSLKLWWIPLTAGFLAGILVMHCAQIRYNGRWFD